MEKQTIKIQGMSCEHCVKAVRGALEGLPGLADVTVDLKGGSASFNYDPAQTEMSAIKAAIVEAGFEA